MIFFIDIEDTRGYLFIYFTDYMNTRGLSSFYMLIEASIANLN